MTEKVTIDTARQTVRDALCGVGATDLELETVDNLISVVVKAATTRDELDE